MIRKSILIQIAKIIGRAFVKYISPFLSVCLFTVIRIILPDQPYSDLYWGYSLIIFLHSWFGGFYSGLLATILSIFVGGYFFAQPVNTLKFFDTGLIYSSIIFFLQSVIIALLASIFGRKFKQEVGIKKNLENKESMLKSIIDTLYGFMVLTDDKGIIIENNNLYQFLQKTNEDLTGKSIFDTYPWKNNLNLGANLRESYMKASRDGSCTIDEEIKIGSKKGYYNINVATIETGTTAKPQYLFVVSGLDITERKVYEQDLEAVHDSYDKLFGANIVGMVIADEKGLIVDANDAFLNLVNYKLEDLKTQNLSLKDITAKEYRRRVENLLKSQTVKGYYGPLQKELVASNGERVPVLVASVLIDETNRKSITLVVDISAQQKIINLKDEFIGIITHELKTPIMTLQGYAQILEKDLNTTDKKDLRKFIEIISRQTDRLNKLVSDLIDFIKLSKDKLVLNTESFDIIEFVNRITSEVDLLNTSHKIILKTNLGKLMVNADHYRIEQVITNLLTNAIRYSPEDKEIIVEIEDTEKYAKISITDYGIGIPKEDIPKVFSKFFQSKSQPQPRQLNKSMGLGLYISSEIIKQHKGKIAVKSEPNKGTTFYFTLPKSS